MEEFRRSGELLHDFADNGWMDHTCSVCKYTENTDVHVDVDWKYCPRCGSRFVTALNEETQKGYIEEFQEGNCLVSIDYEPYKISPIGRIESNHFAIYECSVCGHKDMYEVYDGNRIERPVWNHCPNCGSRLYLKLERV